MVTIDISMFSYHPGTVTIAPGTTVAFHNVDTTEHTSVPSA
jgi:plastocyanin